MFNELRLIFALSIEAIVNPIFNPNSAKNEPVVFIPG